MGDMLSGALKRPVRLVGGLIRSMRAVAMLHFAAEFAEQIEDRVAKCAGTGYRYYNAVCGI